MVHVRLPKCVISALLLIVAAAGSSPTQEWAFDFGTPASPTREGFTKVTKADVFSPAAGHGFESAEGLIEVDRSGSYWPEKQPHPTDADRAKKYGDYRISSFTTCDLVEGTQDNAFILGAPDGEYEVWAVVSDPAEAPPHFQISANGEAKHAVRVARRGFVFIEPFKALAEGSELRIELTGPHGWILSALVVGKPGADLDKLTSDMERDIFFEYGDRVDDWKQLPQEPRNPAPELTAEETARGYVVFSQDYTVKIHPFSNPERRDIDRPLTAFATPGEFEPATAAIYPVRDLGAVDVQVTDFAADDGGTISRDRVEVGVVRCVPQRRGSARGPTGPYTIEPEMIEPTGSRVARVKADETKQWWFTVNVPGDAKPGRYRAEVTFTPEAAPPVAVEWRLLVLPTDLAKLADRHWGTWLDSFPPLGGLRGPERRGRNTPEERDRIARLEMEDFRDHGFDVAILECSSMRVAENPDGTFAYDIGVVRNQMEYLKILGEQAVVPICFEYLCRAIENRYADEPEGEHVAGNFSPKARQAIVGLVEYLESERKANNWPRFLYLPIDEPGNSKTDNRMTFGKNVLEMVQSVPGAETACTITAQGVQQLGDRVNTRIYARGHVNEDVARRDAANGFPYWYYANGMLYGASTIASRGTPGLDFLRSGAECATGWGFAAFHNNPYNDLDGTHPDWSVLLPGPDEPKPTIYWELCREGIDDCRYVATLQDAIAKAGNSAAAARAQAVLEPLLDPHALKIDREAAFHRYRWQVAREIMNISAQTDLTPSVAFTAVASASPMDEVLEDNIIENPSFEDGPQEDGLPGWPYPFTDPFTEDGKKPAGAISVSEEMPHHGRYSLKWDLSKSEGLGSIYGRSRWLIINVQVAQELVPELRGRRVRIGMWLRTNGGTIIPGFQLRMSGTRDGEFTFLEGIPYRGGLQDPVMWNRFEAEGVIIPETEKIDIHIPCKIPDDPEIRDQGLFYIDEVSIRPIKPIPVMIDTPLEELYVGEPLRWSAATPTESERLTVALMRGDEPVEETVMDKPELETEGAFSTDDLAPGIYRLQAVARPVDDAETKAAWRDVIVAPDPFAW